MTDRFDAPFFALRIIVGPAFALSFRPRVVGREHIPKTGAAILASNHASFLDPILIGLNARRPVRFLVSREFYHDRRLKILLRLCGTIPVGGRAGMIRSFRRIAERVGNGELLGIFPEGGITRDGAMRPFRSGAAVIALRMGIPVVQVFHIEESGALPRHARWPRFVPLTLGIGEPIGVVARRDPSSEEIDALTATIRDAVSRLA